LSRVSKRYSKALFSLALEEGILDKVAMDMTSLQELLSAKDSFYSFTKNPLVSVVHKEQVLEELFKSSFQQVTLDFVKLLSRKKRLDTLDDVVKDFAALVLRHRNQLEAEIVSAQALETEQVAAIKKRLQDIFGKEILVSLKEDPALIGGFLVNVNGQIIDNSIRYQLTKLKEQLVA